MRPLTVAMGFWLMAGVADAAVVYSFAEHAGGVTGTLSGTLDLTGAEKFFPQGIAAPALVVPELGALLSGGPPATVWDIYAAEGPASWGPGTGANATASTGSSVGVFGDVFLGGAYLLLPEGSSGGPLNGSMSFAGATLASLGITPGSYAYTLPSDTVTVSFSAIPLPATLPLLLAALGLAAVAGRRRAG